MFSLVYLCENFNTEWPGQLRLYSSSVRGGLSGTLSSPGPQRSAGSSEDSTLGGLWQREGDVPQWGGSPGTVWPPQCIEIGGRDYPQPPREDHHWVHGEWAPGLFSQGETTTWISILDEPSFELLMNISFSLPSFAQSLGEWGPVQYPAAGWHAQRNWCRDALPLREELRPPRPGSQECVGQLQPGL